MRGTVLLLVLGATRWASADERWAEILAGAQLTPDTAQLAPERWTGGGRYRLPRFQWLWDDWRRVLEVLPTAPFGGADGPSAESAVAVAWQALESGWPAATPPDQPRRRLAEGIAALCESTGALGEAERVALGNRLREVPESVAAAAVVVLDAVPATLSARAAALDGLSPDQRAAAERQLIALALGYRVDADTLQLLEQLDGHRLADAGAGLLRAALSAAGLLTEPPAGDFDFEWLTPFGWIVLRGDGARALDARPYLLVIDTGGNDTYHAGGGATAACPVAVLLEAGGDDRYEAQAAAFGSGLLGYGVHIDLAGDDRYEAETFAQGAAAGGLGVLFDAGGEDMYQLKRWGQGAASLGAGLLLDGGGDDAYVCYQMAQGYGQVKGLGLLADRAGDDRYEANDTDIIYPSPQTAEHNVSLAQGCGFGRRAHPGDGNSLGGGEGFLIDLAGNDDYSCGVFGQGCAYWYATGMLVDRAGNDRHRGVWYTQAASAHYAVAALLDEAGDDRYEATMAFSVGAGHDYSLAVLWDRNGNDSYINPAIGLGGGLWNGIGVFWDEAGDDDYQVSAQCLGWAGEARPEHLCGGFFRDDHGVDRFPEANGATAGGRWARPVDPSRPRSLGAGGSYGRAP